MNLISPSELVQFLNDYPQFTEVLTQRPDHDFEQAFYHSPRHPDTPQTVEMPKPIPVVFEARPYRSGALSCWHWVLLHGVDCSRP